MKFTKKFGFLCEDYSTEQYLWGTSITFEKYKFIFKNGYAISIIQYNDLYEIRKGLSDEEKVYQVAIMNYHKNEIIKEDFSIAGYNFCYGVRSYLQGSDIEKILKEIKQLPAIKEIEPMYYSFTVIDMNLDNCLFLEEGKTYLDIHPLYFELLESSKEIADYLKTIFYLSRYEIEQLSNMDFEELKKHMPKSSRWDTLFKRKVVTRNSKKIKSLTIA